MSACACCYLCVFTQCAAVFMCVSFYGTVTFHRHSNLTQQMQTVGISPYEGQFQSAVSTPSAICMLIFCLDTSLLHLGLTLRKMIVTG